MQDQGGKAEKAKGVAVGGRGRQRSASTAPATDPGAEGLRGVQATEGTGALAGHGAIDGSRQRVYSGLRLPRGQRPGHCRAWGMQPPGVGPGHGGYGARKGSEGKQGQDGHHVLMDRPSRTD